MHSITVYSLFFLTWALEFAPAQCYHHQFRDKSGAKLGKTNCSYGILHFNLISYGYTLEFVLCLSIRNVSTSLHHMASFKDTITLTQPY